MPGSVFKYLSIVKRKFFMRPTLEKLFKLDPRRIMYERSLVFFHILKKIWITIGQRSIFIKYAPPPPPFLGSLILFDEMTFFAGSTPSALKSHFKFIFRFLNFWFFWDTRWSQVSFDLIRTPIFGVAEQLLFKDLFQQSTPSAQKSHFKILSNFQWKSFFETPGRPFQNVKVEYLNSL